MFEAGQAQDLPGYLELYSCRELSIIAGVLIETIPGVGNLLYLGTPYLEVTGYSIQI